MEQAGHVGQKKPKVKESRHRRSKRVSVKLPIQAIMKECELKMQTIRGAVCILHQMLETVTHGTLKQQ